MHFLDTYAIVEIIKGNPAYKKFADSASVTTSYNLMELYYILLRLYDEKTAEKYYAQFRPICVPVSEDTVKQAMKFRLSQRKKKNLISYIDCIGYIMSLELGIKFLTGEKHFTELKNVEFVK
ncbi:PIN domain-containing protein [Candidatus Woesearchaeota archaeon]|nr:PIN domain-containing protein [Candidatus Woesearchaeota archaeon]